MSNRGPSQTLLCASIRTPGTFQSWAIPGGGDIVRNMTVDHDGSPIMANSLANLVGRIEIKSTTN